MLEHYGIPIARSRAVVIGRSEIVGKPMAMLLLARDATVTISGHWIFPPSPAKPTSWWRRSGGPASSRRRL